MGFFDNAVNNLAGVATLGTLGYRDGRLQPGSTLRQAGGALSSDRFRNFFLNLMTGGLAGMEDGRPSLSGGVFTESADEILGELTGRNLQRQSMQDANSLFRKESAAREQMILDEQRRRVDMDMRASKAAAVGRRQVYGKGRTNTRVSPLGDIEKDFLGL